MQEPNSSSTRALVCGVLLASVILSGCGQSGGSGPGAGGPPPAPQVSVAPSVQRQIQEFDEFTGRLEATETVDVRPRVAGTIDRVHFKEGQSVKKGDLLFTVDARPFRAELARAEAQLAAAQTQSELAGTEFARAQKLLEIKAISRQEFDQLQSGTRSSDANIRAAQAAVQAARLNVEYATIRSPIAGRVSRANVTAGNLVGNAEPILTTIVSQQKVYAYFDASEQTYLKYVKSARDGTRPSSRETANPVLMGLASEQGYPHKGVIDFVDNRLNPQTGAIRARAVFDNAKNEFTPGLFARVKLIGSGTYNAIMTPDRAIGTDQDKKFVLVVGADNVAQFRPVRLGALQDGMRVITEGLKAGEMVIVDGLQRVRPGMPVAPQKVEVDQNGMPIEKPAAPPGAPPKQEEKAPAKKDEKKA
ncbi:MAG: efflux RND transporter periplasmic adaptor subunit [Casimicrobium sp.]